MDRDPRIDAAIASKQVIAHEPDRGPVPTKAEQGHALAKLALIGVGVVGVGEALNAGFAFLHSCAIENLVGAAGTVSDCVSNVPLWLHYLGQHVK